ncbi:S1C family serine protease [Brevibacterium litoralis]|uniref:S1C family serine protease n=1 Tax=Brevibacterium litoralis TaxID=3138935 RepID=UPI0032F001D5
MTDPTRPDPTRPDAAGPTGPAAPTPPDHAPSTGRTRATGQALSADEATSPQVPPVPHGAPQGAAGPGSPYGHRGPLPGSAPGQGSAYGQNLPYGQSSPHGQTSPYGQGAWQGQGSGQGQGASAAGTFGAAPGARPPGGSAPEGPRRGRRGPGWGGVLGIALVAALLGGGLGAGSAWFLDDSAGSATTPTVAAGKDSPDAVNTDGLAWTDVAAAASPAVTAIQVVVGGQLAGQGSGWVYDAENGYIVTNNHVVAEADTPGGTVQVVFSDGQTVEATIVGRDPETDIAVIQVQQLPEGTPALSIGDSSGLEVGDPVMALGNPLGLADTVTTGIVSALDRPVTTTNIGQNASEQEVAQTITSAIQTDAAINPGNSGGPLVNAAGELVGVNSSAATLQDAGASGQAGSIGIGFAIPASQAQNIADQLIEHGSAEHPVLGVSIASGEAEVNGLPRAAVTLVDVQADSPAADAGLQADDRVISVDGKYVNGIISLQALVRAHAVGDEVTIGYVRDGEVEETTAVLAGE